MFCYIKKRALAVWRDEDGDGMSGPTKAQCVEIARATRRICNRNNYGNYVVIWPDFSWSEAEGPNSSTGRKSIHDPEASIEFPITKFRIPLSAADVGEIIRAKTARRGISPDAEA